MEQWRERSFELYLSPPGRTPRVGPPRDYSVKHYLPGFGEHFG